MAGPASRSGVPITRAGRHRARAARAAEVGEAARATPYDEGYPAPVPDGRWLAYVSNEANRRKSICRALDGTAGKLLVSQNGGSEPLWSRDGRELFYRSLGPGEPQLVAARIETTPSHSASSRAPRYSPSPTTRPPSRTRTTT